jgi:hypothetical protein
MQVSGQPVRVTLYVRMARLTIPGAFNVSVRQFCTDGEGCRAVGPTLSVLPGQSLQVRVPPPRRVRVCATCVRHVCAPRVSKSRSRGAWLVHTHTHTPGYPCEPARGGVQPRGQGPQ